MVMITVHQQQPSLTTTKPNICTCYSVAQNSKLMKRGNFKTIGSVFAVLPVILSLSACAGNSSSTVSATEDLIAEAASSAETANNVSAASDSGVTNAPAEPSESFPSEEDSSNEKTEAATTAEIEEVPGQFGDTVKQDEIHTGAVYLDTGLISMTDSSSKDVTDTLLMNGTKIRTPDYDIDLGTFFDHVALEYFVSDYARQLNIYDLEDYSFAGDGLMYVIQVSDSVPANLTGNHSYFGCLEKKSDNAPYYITVINTGYKDGIAEQIQSHFTPSDSYAFHPAKKNTFVNGTYYFVVRSIDRGNMTMTGTLELPAEASKMPDLPWKNFTDSNYVRYQTCDILSADNSISSGMLETIKKYSDNKQMFVQEVSTSRYAGIQDGENGGYRFYCLDHPEIPMLDTLVIHMPISIKDAVFIKSENGNSMQLKAEDIFADESRLPIDSVCRVELQNGVPARVEILGITQPVP